MLYQHTGVGEPDVYVSNKNLISYFGCVGQLLSTMIRFISSITTFGLRLSPSLDMMHKLWSFSINITDTSISGGISLSMWNTFACGRINRTISGTLVQYYLRLTST